MSQEKIQKIAQKAGSTAEAQVAVVIPTFDRAHLLPRALASVLSQSRPPREVWVVDDGSTDGTAELIRRDFPRASYLAQDNRGVSAARNRGLASSSAPWIAFLDSDDAWKPEKLERQLDALAAAPELRICHSDEIWIRGGRRVNPGRRHAKAGGWMFHHCLPLCAISPSSALIHRSVFEEIGGFDEDLPACEDYDLWLRITSRMPVLLVDEPLVVKYGGHEDQLSRREPALDRFRIRALEKILGAGILGGEDRAAALATLRQKARIYAGGLRKRGREAEAEALLERVTRIAELACRDEAPTRGKALGRGEVP